MIQVLLAEDHETVRQGLKLLIDRQPDMVVVADVANGKAAIEQAAALRPAVVIMDLSMPGTNGLDATRSIHQRLPSTAVVALTRYGDTAYVNEMMAAGASGYVLKQSSSAELIAAVRAVAAGKQYLDRALVERGVVLPNSRRATGPPVATEREKEVLRLMARGFSNKEIASALKLSVKTVEVHKTNATRKLNLSGRADVVRYASVQGWLDDI